MPIQRIVFNFAFVVSPMHAADPPKPAVKKLYGLHTPRVLDIYDDGSGRLG